MYFSVVKDYYRPDYYKTADYTGSDIEDDDDDVDETSDTSGGFGFLG